MTFVSDGTLGYDDLIDHDKLRHDPALAAVIDKPGGTLVGKSTLNRLEHASKIGGDRHHKLDHDRAAIERLFVDLFVEAYRAPPRRIFIDLDATDDPLYREQEGRHLHGYYDCYCYLPLYIFCGRHLLATKLRSSVNNAGDGATDRQVGCARIMNIEDQNTGVGCGNEKCSRIRSKVSPDHLRVIAPLAGDFYGIHCHHPWEWCTTDVSTPSMQHA